MITSSQSAYTRAGKLCVLALAILVSWAGATPARAAVPAPEAEQSELRGAVYDSSGLPLIGALIAVAVPGARSPAALTVTDSSGRFVVAELNPGVYSVMARSFGFISAIVPEIAIPRPEPVRLQLRSERQVASLLAAGARLDLGWAFRSSVRDVLRQTESTKRGADTGSADWLSASTEAPLWERVGGELSLWTVAPMSGIADDGRSATDFALGSYDTGSQNWILRGQLADGGVVRARSDVSRVLSDSHGVRLGIGFAGKDLGGDDITGERRRMWVGSLSAEDYWRFGESLKVGYGLRFEHYNYLQESALISPRVQVSFAPVASITLSTSVSYEAEAPGLAELRFQVDPLAVQYMDIVSVEDIEPERNLRYEIGIARATANTEVRARAFHDEVSDELVGVYLANPNGSSDYTVANVGDSVTQGIEVDVRQSIIDNVAGLISYAYGRRDGGALPAELAAENGLLADAGFDADVADVDVVHELAAGLETVVGSYDTRLLAMYRWKSGVPVVRHGNLESVYERLDFGVRQPLPFRALASDWSALIQVQNVLGRSYEGVFDFRLGDAPVLSRLVSGGLAVRF